MSLLPLLTAETGPSQSASREPIIWIQDDPIREFLLSSFPNYTPEVIDRALKENHRDVDVILSTFFGKCDE